jgi:hypothetical protein
MRVLGKLLEKNSDPDGGVIYAYTAYLTRRRYGVVEFDEDNKANQSGGKAFSLQSQTMPCRDCIFMITLW